ncbi:malate dehydrogenase [Candidatus Omnitrophota bacterium]
MPKITIIGAGQVGSTLAMRVVDANIANVAIIDIVKNTLEGKTLDLQDAASAAKVNRKIDFSDDFSVAKDSDIIVITAGFPRKPGMTREDLVQKNALIIKEIAHNIGQLSYQPIIIVVTNPVDIMTTYFFKQTQYPSSKLLGFGISLDAARFANLISQELKVSVATVEATVIAAHGKGMLPLPRFSYVDGKPLTELLSEEKITDLCAQTVQRGARIVSCLGSGSAYFAPSAALFKMVNALLSNDGTIVGASVLLNGHYGITDAFAGVPVKLGKEGIEEVVELDLNEQEREALLQTANKLEQCTISV